MADATAFPRGCRGLALQQCQTYADHADVEGFKKSKDTPCQTKTYGEKNVSVKVPWFRPLAIDD